MSKFLTEFFYLTGKIVIVFIFLSFFNNQVSSDNVMLNTNLAECYRKANIKPFVPSTLQILIELIRKLENASNIPGDIRLLSTKLFHHLRVDGIQKDPNSTETEFVIPYSPNGLLSQKYSILKKLIPDVPGDFPIQDYLTSLEICTLHKILSSTIEPTLRGDEFLTCMDSKNDFLANRVVVNENDIPTVISYKTSRCPIEWGVIRTRSFGTISPGTLISSIASGLLPQAVQLKEIFPFLEVSKRKLQYQGNKYEKKETESILLSSMNDRVNNTFASNLAGDLAEVCLFQSPYYNEKVQVGSFGFWNNFEYPVLHFLNDSNILNWFMTDSEILSGIDGYHLANNIHNWVNQIPSLRLSQILELYYSEKGISNFKTENSNRRIFSNNEKISKNSGVYFKPTMLDFDDIRFDSNSACNRINILKNIERQKLKYETYLLAKILQYTANTPLVDDTVLKKACDVAIDKFLERAKDLIEKNEGCNSYSKALIDLILILDGSRNQSENYKLISHIAEIIDVTPSSSGFSIINGGNGQYMVKRTQSIIEGFQQLQSHSNKHPHGLSLTKSLSTIIFSLENNTKEEKSEIAGLSPVIVIISQAQRIQDNDFKDAKRLLEGSFRYNQNIYFVFITDDGVRFDEMLSDERMNPLNSKDKFTVIDTNDLEVKSIGLQLLRKFRSIPKWLRPLSCDYEEYEDYVGTQYANYYRINSYELQKYRQMLVQFQVAETYGIITVCKNADNQPWECISTRNSLFEEVIFGISDTCSDENHCPSINFKVEMDKTNVKCTENSCRYPDDIRINIRIKRTGCNGVSPTLKFSFTCFMFSFILKLIY